jgi:hypothetical protein
VNDDSMFLLQIAEVLRSWEVRTQVAREAYDGLADQLTELACGGEPGFVPANHNSFAAMTVASRVAL